MQYSTKIINMHEIVSKVEFIMIWHAAFEFFLQFVKIVGKLATKVFTQERIDHWIDDVIQKVRCVKKVVVFDYF